MWIQRSATAPGVLLLLLACASAKPGSVAAPAQPEQPALWVVRDADSTLYLYGTIHLRTSGAPWGGPIAERALAEAQEVWTEVELEPPSQVELRDLMERHGIDRAVPLSAKIEPERAEQLSAVAKKLDMPPQAFEAMQPWFAAMVLAIVPLVQAGYSPESGVDRAIGRSAKESGQELRWLEDGDEQMQFMSGLPQEIQIEMLYEVLDDIGKAPEALRQIEAAWEKGDDTALAALNAEALETYPDLYRAMVTRRNEVWAEALAEELEGAGVDFVAVGAGHLAGPDSLQARLAARGHPVERLTPAP